MKERKTIQKSSFTDCKGRNIGTAPETYALGTLGLLQYVESSVIKAKMQSLWALPPFSEIVWSHKK